MRSSSGFTLVELLVSIGLAGIVMVSLLGFFATFIEHQVRLQNERSALETIRFLFTDLSRELYFGHDYVCGGRDETDNTVCRCLAFSDQLGRRVKVWHNTDDHRVEIATNYLDPDPNTCDSSSDQWVPLTDDAVSIVDFVFKLEDPDGSTQPRVMMRIAVDYEIDGVLKNVSFKTQVTARIVEPSADILNLVIVGSETDTISDIYFVYAPRVDENGNYIDEVGSPLSNPEFVCQDANGVGYDDHFCKDTPAAAEFTADGLYILGNSGLLFFIPKASSDGTASIDHAMTATGAIGSNPSVTISSSSVQSGLVRVLGEKGNGTCRLYHNGPPCINDPRSVVSIHPVGSYLYAVGASGSLYKVSSDGGTAAAKRIMEGGVSKNTVRYFNADGGDDRILMLFKDIIGNRIVRLFSGDDSISSGDITGDSCGGFSYVPNSAGCRQLYPDPGLAVEPNELGNISFSFLERLQVINDTVSFWYRDNEEYKTVSVGTGSDVLERDDRIAEGSTFAYGNGLTNYTSICDDSVSLCAIDSITDNTVTVIGAGGNTTLRKHKHLNGYPVAINDAGRFVYFNGVATDSASAEFPVYNPSGVGGSNERRVLCSTVPIDDQQVSFKYISEKHENEDLMALLGRSLDSGGQGHVTEIYILQPTTDERKHFEGDDLDVVCGETAHIERYHLPTSLDTNSYGGLDLVRFRSVVLMEPKP